MDPSFLEYVFFLMTNDIMQVSFVVIPLFLPTFVVLFAFRSDPISRSVVSDSLPPHESQHARSPCPSPTPGVHSDSRPSSQ